MRVMVTRISSRSYRWREREELEQVGGSKLMKKRKDRIHEAYKSSPTTIVDFRLIVCSVPLHLTFVYYGPFTSLFYFTRSLRNKNVGVSIIYGVCFSLPQLV